MAKIEIKDLYKTYDNKKNIFYTYTNKSKIMSALNERE